MADQGDGDPVADGDVVHSLADLDDLAGRLVAQNHRALAAQLAVGEVDVGMADRAGHDLHANLARARWALVQIPEFKGFPVFGQNGGAHGFLPALSAPRSFGDAEIASPDGRRAGIDMKSAPRCRSAPVSDRGRVAALSPGKHQLPGTITLSMTWITPFDASMSAEITFAPSTVTPLVASMATLSPCTVFALSVLPAMSPDMTFPGRT